MPSTRMDNVATRRTKSTASSALRRDSRYWLTRRIAIIFTNAAVVNASKWHARLVNVSIGNWLRANREQKCDATSKMFVDIKILPTRSFSLAIWIAVLSKFILTRKQRYLFDFTLSYVVFQIPFLWKQKSKPVQTSVPKRHGLQLKQISVRQQSPCRWLLGEKSLKINHHFIWQWVKTFIFIAEQCPSTAHGIAVPFSWVKTPTPHYATIYLW